MGKITVVKEGAVGAPAALTYRLIADGALLDDGDLAHGRTLPASVGGAAAVHAHVCASSRRIALNVGGRADFEAAGPYA